MKNNFLNLPDKIFGIETSLIGMFLVPLVMVILFLVSLGAIIIPKIDQIKELNQKITVVKDQRKSTLEKKNYLLSIDQEELKRNESYLNNAVLREKNSYILVGVIRRICDKYGFQIQSFSISPGKLKDDSNQVLKVADKEVAVKMPVDVVLLGSTENSLELIKSLEKSLPILFIDRLETKKIGEASELSMTVSSYYVADKRDLVSGNLSLNDLKPTKEETDLLTTISQFEKSQDFENVSTTEGKQFVKYDRQDPFGI